MQVKTSKLEGVALDYMVAMCEWGDKFSCYSDLVAIANRQKYSSDWTIAGPIIQREGYAIVPPDHNVPVWCVGKWNDGLDDSVRFGPTPLIAAMRCYVASKMGDVVEVPIDLI